MITSQIPVSNATDSPLPVGEGLGVRSNLTKRQIEVTMFATAAGTLRDLKNSEIARG